MKKPYYNNKERRILLSDTLQGDILRLSKETLKFRKSYHKHNGLIIGEILFRWDMKQILKPINEQIKRNWK